MSNLHIYTARMFDREREANIKFMICCNVTSVYQYQQKSGHKNVHILHGNNSRSGQNIISPISEDNDHDVPTRRHILLPSASSSSSSSSSLVQFRKQCIIQILDRYVNNIMHIWDFIDVFKYVLIVVE